MNNRADILSRITRGSRRISYGGLWTSYKTVWVNLDGWCEGGMFDVYSQKCWVPGQEQCGNFRVEGDCYNREHSWPKSWWGGSNNAAYSDMFHVVPSDGKVNGMRSAHPFGVVNNPKYTSNEGHKTGDCSSGGGTCFEPVDRVKGFMARSHNYVSLRYGYDMPSETTALMKQWNAAFPPAIWEKQVNDRVEQEQGNRNPFIDFPSLVDTL